MTRDEAFRLRAIVEQAAASLDDQTASEGATLFPRLKGDGSLVSAGTRICWNGVIKRAAVDLWDVEANDPEEAPHLWEDIAYRQGYRIIPATITAGAAFDQGEWGWWGDVLYKSLIASNVWTPDAYPAGWEAVNA